MSNRETMKRAEHDLTVTCNNLMESIHYLRTDNAKMNQCAGLLAEALEKVKAALTLITKGK